MLIGQFPGFVVQLHEFRTGLEDGAGKDVAPAKTGLSGATAHFYPENPVLCLDVKGVLIAGNVLEFAGGDGRQVQRLHRPLLQVPDIEDGGRFRPADSGGHIEFSLLHIQPLADGIETEAGHLFDEVIIQRVFRFEGDKSAF